MIVICLYGRALLWMEYRFICRDAFPSIDCPFRNLKRVIPIYVSVHVFLIVHTDLFHGDSKSTDLFFAGRSLPESTVHSKLSVWYWCYVHVFFIVCYKYTNIFIKYIVLLYFFYWFALSKTNSKLNAIHYFYSYKVKSFNLKRCVSEYLAMEFVWWVIL